jgi:hypothetical protein
MSVKVKMCLEEETIKKVDYLFGFFETNNRSSIVAGSINLSLMIANEIMNGGKIIVERSDGRLFELSKPK